MLVIVVVPVLAAVCLATAWWWCCVEDQKDDTNHGRHDETKPLPDDHLQGDVEDRRNLQHDISPKELRALREAQHGQVAISFYEFDADESGYLEVCEVGAFCAKLGLLLTEAEVAQALSEMESSRDSTRDGKVDFDEFVAWWTSGSRTKQKGTLAFQMQEAKEAAFEAELAADSPMGRLLAQRHSTPPRASSRGQMASTPPRESSVDQSGSTNNRTGTPSKSTRTAANVAVAQLVPPPLPPVQNRGGDADANARRARAAERLALSRARAQTPPRRVQL